jgi:hypothetical protein
MPERAFAPTVVQRWQGLCCANFSTCGFVTRLARMRDCWCCDHCRDHSLFARRRGIRCFLSMGEWRTRCPRSFASGPGCHFHSNIPTTGTASTRARTASGSGTHSDNPFGGYQLSTRHSYAGSADVHSRRKLFLSQGTEYGLRRPRQRQRR